MASRSTGFTLLEVMVALLIITIGVLGLAGTLGPITALAGEGRARGRAALALESRLNRLRAELLRSAPACVAPAAGSQRNPDGIVESWSAAPRAGLIEIEIVAVAPKSRMADSLVTRLSCP